MHKNTDVSTYTEQAPATTVIERRREERWPACGAVELYLGWPSQRRFTARLLDCSNRGFRAVHNMTLITGTEVRFSHTHGAGIARVVWSRVDGTSVENGFLIIEQWPAGRI